QIGSEICIARHVARLPVARFRDLENGARLRIPLAETQEVEGEIFRHDDEVGLQVIGSETAGRTSQLSRSRRGSNFLPRHVLHHTRGRGAICPPCYSRPQLKPTMRITVVGAGPAGLYFAILMKKADPSHEIGVFERDGADDTFGW